MCKDSSVKYREQLKDCKRVVIKIGTTTITHANTGSLNLIKLEKLVRILTDLRNQGKDVILVSSGAISVGRKALGLTKRPKEKSVKQACAAVGQARLMMVYQKLFAEYNQIPAQVLMTKYTMVNDTNRENAKNTFNELLGMGVIPIVNENDTVATDEIEFGDNDSLSAIVSALVGADLLILLSDIDGMYTDDPNCNKDAKLIECVTTFNSSLYEMGKGSNSDYGTGGMSTKIAAAKIATDSGANMIIANGKDLEIINSVIAGDNVGTLFVAHDVEDFNLIDYINS